MPLLPAEENIHPSGLFDVPAGERPWWGAHVCSRQEKLLARHLLAHGVPFYLPLQLKSVVRDGRRLVSHIPLFPGYVFFRGDGGDRRRAVESNVIARVLEVEDQDRIHRELEDIRRLEAAGASFMPCTEFVAGDHVRVVHGPLAGCSGELSHAKGKHRYVVTLTLLQRMVCAELDGAALAPLSRS